MIVLYHIVRIIFKFVDSTIWSVQTNSIISRNPRTDQSQNWKRKGKRILRRGSICCSFGKQRFHKQLPHARLR